MKLTPRGINAQYVNGDENYRLMTCFGSPTLVYGAESKIKKMHEGVAFKDVDTMRLVAHEMLKFADELEKKKRK